MKINKKNTNINSIEEWMPFKSLYQNGVIELKENSYIKILKVTPINYNLKKDLEKKAILNSYKLFLKTYNQDIQILIQSTKKDLSKQIFNIYKLLEKENNFNIQKLSKEYIKYLKQLNENKKTSSKKFYIIIKKKNKKNEIKDKKYINNIIHELNDNYYKIKECLARCGNNVFEIKSKEELILILKSFFNFEEKEEY